MAVRFYKGASLQTTRSINQKGKSPAVQSNSMKGMPGRIDTAQKRDSSDTLNGPAIKVKHPGPIGKRGGAHRANQQKGKGSTDKSYRATSTARPGTYSSSNVGHNGRMEKLIGKARMSTEK